MNALAIEKQMQQAAQLIAGKHGLVSAVVMTGTAKSVTFTVTIGEKVTGDDAIVAKHQTQQMRVGHVRFKARYPQLLSDAMLGRRFVLFGHEMIYLGCLKGRPTYPVSVWDVNRGEIRKCRVGAITQMATQMRALNISDSNTDTMVTRATQKVSAGLDGGMF